MLTLNQIQREYAPEQQKSEESILREYLQYKILDLIFASSYANKLSFLGGTALRLIYENRRFSEDLDFDNFGLKKDEFGQIADYVRDGLIAQGLQVEVDVVGQAAYRCRVKVPDILYNEGISPHYDEKILIQLDSVAHNFEYTPDIKVLKKFDTLCNIFVTPADIILAQKCHACVSRPRAKGRDFYDISFLLGFTKPNYAYLEHKIGIKNADELRAFLLDKTATFDFKALATDVKPFLFNPAEVNHVERFRDIIEQSDLG